MNPGQDVDVAGPGVDVQSSVPGGGHERFDGTSMATPHVAAIAALLAQSSTSLRGWKLWARPEQLVKRLDAPSDLINKIQKIDARGLGPQRSDVQAVVNSAV